MLAIGVFAIFAVGITYLSISTLDNNGRVILNNEALQYAQEGLEVARNIRDRSYLTLTNGDHGLSFAEGAWSFGLAPERVDDFYDRYVTISDVYRDVDGNIDPDGTVYDPDTKRIDSKINWLQNGIIPRSITLTEYLSNWKGDDWIRTTCSEFSGGIFDNTEVVDMDPPPDNNCGLRLKDIETGSSFFSSANIGKHAEDVDIDGNYAYLATDDMHGGFSVVNITNPSVPIITNTKDIGGKGLTVKKDGSYAYVGYGQSIKILNVSTPSNPSITGTISLGATPNQIEVKDNYLYVASSSTAGAFKVYDITSKSTPVLKKTLNLNDALHSIKIQGNYAYIGSYDDNNGFRVINISNPINATQVGSLSIGEEVHSISINGSIAYAGTENSKLKVIDISTPATPVLMTTVATSSVLQDLTISGDYLYAAIDSVNSGLAAFNISNPYSPYFVYNLDAGGKATGIDSDGSHIYITTDTANKGLVIIGTTVIGMNTSGTYISDVLNTGSSAATYNFIEWVHDEVAGGTLKFRLRTASTSGGIASATWAGPDGTDSTYYTTSRTPIVLAEDSTGTQYSQYKAFMESDGLDSPVLKSVRVNYTP